MGAKTASKAKLPAKIVPVLDEAMQGVSPGKWAAAKIRTYSMQREPFVHLDHDVFLMQEPPPAAAGFAMSVQHLENLPINEVFYRRLALDFYQDTGSFPPDVGEAIAAGRPWGYNCGYLAVHNQQGLDFMTAYTETAWDAFARMRKTDRRNCAFAEQLVLQAAARARGVAVRCLLSSDPQEHTRQAMAIDYYHLAGKKYRGRERSHSWVLDQLSRL